MYFIFKRVQFSWIRFQPKEVGWMTGYGDRREGMDSYRWGKELTVLTVQMACAVQVQAYYWLSENKGRDTSLDPPIVSLN